MAISDTRANILIVDDRQENLVALEAILEPLDQRLVRASSGQEALRHLLLEDFALILLDVHMPIMDGFETAALIKQREKSRYIPIIFITANNTDEHLAFKGYTIGAVDYVAKPFDPDILRSKVMVFVELYQKNEQIQRQAQLLRENEQREAQRSRDELKRELDERRLAELAASEARLSEFKSTLDATIDCVFIVDPDTLRYVYANQGAINALGYSTDELLEKSAADIMPVVGVQEFRRILDHLADGANEARSFETRYRRRDGGEIPVEVFLQYIALPGERGRFVSVARDITERQQAQIALGIAYEREKRIATVLQSSMLLAPPEDAFPGLTIATFYEPALDEALLGGDFFDVFALEEGRVAMVVGDVTGKGLAAAARTAEVKYALRAFLRESNDPLTALHRVNSVLCDSRRFDNPQSDAFVCISLVVIDPANGHALYTGAGTEPPLVIDRGGACKIVDAVGLPLGIVTDVEYERRSFSLNSGDIVLMVTDGITEARRDDDLLGYDGMSRLAAEAAHLGSPRLIGQSILDGARSYAGGKLHDDACVLIATLDGQPLTAERVPKRDARRAAKRRRESEPLTRV